MDLRMPIGVLFVVLGALLAGYGLVTHASPEANPGINVNLIWGAVMVVFGILMWAGARFGRTLH